MSIESHRTEDEKAAKKLRDVRLAYWQNRAKEIDAELANVNTSVSDFNRLTQARNNAKLRIKNLKNGY